MRIELPSSAAADGAVASVRMPILIDGKPVVSQRASPRLGADTDQVINDPAWRVSKG